MEVELNEYKKIFTRMIARDMKVNIYFIYIIVSIYTHF